ncbi:MAG: biopolymer transporter ExbD [Pseudomonadota bacterium]
MDFSPPPRKPRSEQIVPMINVVFLLLIFFLMTSQIAPPDPFELTPPTANLEGEATAEPILYISATGTMHFDGTEGRQALTRLAPLAGDTDVLLIKADAQLAASTLAKTLTAVTQAGFASVEIVVAGP